MNNFEKYFSKHLPDGIHASLGDMIDNNLFLDAFQNKKNHYTIEHKWAIPHGMTFQEFVQKHSDHHIFTRHNNAFMFYNWGYVTIFYDNQIIVTVSRGPLEEINNFSESISNSAIKSECTIEWYYQARHGIQSSSHPLRYRKAYDSFYPQLTVPLEQYFKDYNNSESCILVLIGPPGTGKTSLIENLLFATKSNAVVTYDEKVMSDDNFFISFMSDNDSRFMIMEDADLFIGARKDGNNMMHKFLNVSDGLVASKHKKMIFSTNLPSINSVDEALLRPGRCYDILQFRPLNRQEASLACKDLNKELTEEGDQFFLTDIFNTKKMSSIKQKVGF